MHPADHPGPLVYLDDLEDPQLTDDDAHHLVRVLRLRVGDPLIVGDGAGRWRPAVLRDDGRAEPTGAVESIERPSPALSVGFALVKGDKPELIVQKLTELGIDRIVPFRAERSIVQWDDAKAAKAVVRWRSVARSAAMQSHRAHLPEVAEVAELGPLLEAGAALADRSGAPPSLARPFLLVGPEGGWTDAERARAAGSVDLGEHVLRAETAAVAAGTLLAALRAGLVAERGGSY